MTFLDKKITETRFTGTEHTQEKQFLKTCRGTLTRFFCIQEETTSLMPVTSELTQKDIEAFNKDDKDGRGTYSTVSLQKTGGPGPETTYDYVDNSGHVWKCPTKGWRMRKQKLKALENDGRLYITDTTIREKYYLKERLEIGKQIDNFWGDIGNMNRSSDIELWLRRAKAREAY